MRHVLDRIPKVEHPDLLVGVNTIDDAGVFRLSDEMALVQTVDFFTPIVDDPYTYGAIAAANSLSDVYAMGGEPVTALNIVCYPKGTMSPDMLAQILQGAHDKATEAGCPIIGGHSVEDKEMKFGLSVTGKIHPQKILTNANARAGDALVLTKPLGTGIVTTAFKLATIADEQYRQVTDAMLQLNATASRLAVEWGAHACTDITGFSLLGHAWGMAQASKVGMIFDAAQLPLFSGVETLAAQGYLTGGARSNRDYVGQHIRISDSIAEEMVHVLYDPQTSGGLLVAIPQDVAAEYIKALHAAGVKAAAIIGKVEDSEPGVIRVV